VNKDLQRMGLTWEEVEASAQDRQTWRQRVALCIGDAGWIKSGCLPLLPFTHASSVSINADNLKLQLQLGRRDGGRPQRAVHPMQLPVNTVIHTTLCSEKNTHSPFLPYLHVSGCFFFWTQCTLVGLEPATFRSLVRRATSSATEPALKLIVWRLYCHVLCSLL